MDKFIGGEGTVRKAGVQAGLENLPDRFVDVGDRQPALPSKYLHRAHPGRI
jgi:hypothetical protein